jgi:hypothetical protein
MAGKWSKIAMESCASWESTRATAHFARKMVEKWRHIREETKRKMALLKRKTRFRQAGDASLLIAYGEYRAAKPR